MKPPSDTLGLMFPASHVRLQPFSAVALFPLHCRPVFMYPLLRPNKMTWSHLYMPRAVLELWLCLGSSPRWNDPTDSCSELELITFCLML